MARLDISKIYLSVPYYECHITVEPVFGKRLELFQKLAGICGFRVADLLMQKDREATPERSAQDSFCTGRSKPDLKGDAAYEELYLRSGSLCAQLRMEDFSVWRWKIEAILMDNKYT